ncbi:MAG: hypothetical protein ACTTIC_03010 [Helicobacteraceae bacterium]
MIEEKRQEVERLKREIPYELLGKSLSFSPFFPKDAAGLKKQGTNANILGFVDSAGGIARALEHEALGAAGLFLDTDLDTLGLIKRHTQGILISGELIVDNYQVLRSLVFGADLITLRNVLPKKELKEFLDFARRLAMDAVFVVQDLSDLKTAVFIGADVLYLKDPALVSSTPNSKTLILESPTPAADCVIVR